VLGQVVVARQQLVTDGARERLLTVVASVRQYLHISHTHQPVINHNHHNLPFQRPSYPRSHVNPVTARQRSERPRFRALDTQKDRPRYSVCSNRPLSGQRRNAAELSSGTYHFEQRRVPSPAVGETQFLQTTAVKHCTHRGPGGQYSRPSLRLSES